MIRIGVILLLIGIVIHLSFMYFSWSWPNPSKQKKSSKYDELYTTLLPLIRPIFFLINSIVVFFIALQFGLLLLAKLYLNRILIGIGLLLIVYGATASLLLTFLTLSGEGAIIFLWHLLTYHFQKISFFLYELTVGNMRAFLRSRRGFPDRARMVAVFNHKPRVIKALAWLPASADEQERIVIAQDIYLSAWQPQNAVVFPNEDRSGGRSSELLGSMYGTITAIAVSPDQNYIASCTERQSIEFCPCKYSPDAANHPLEEYAIANYKGETTHLHPYSSTVGVNGISWASFLPYRIAFGTADHRVKVWQIDAPFYESPSTQRIKDTAAEFQGSRPGAKGEYLSLFHFIPFPFVRTRSYSSSMTPMKEASLGQKPG